MECVGKGDVLWWRRIDSGDKGERAMLVKSLISTPHMG
jgi:hypothetical protein